MKKQLTSIFLLTVALIFGLSVFSVFATGTGTWSDPGAGCTPPTCNTDAPLNAGDNAQTKSGMLTLGASGTFANGLIVGTGNVGIGTVSPSTKLEVVGGPIKATSGLIIETVAADPTSPQTGRMWLLQ